MIDRVYIIHSQKDENLAKELFHVLWAVNLESFSPLLKKAPSISMAERIHYGIRHADCAIAIITGEGSVSPCANQEIGLAVASGQLIIPLLEKGEELPVLISHLQPVTFTKNTYEDALGMVVQNIRNLTRLDWLKIRCPYCGEEMTQYITPQEEIDKALMAGNDLETMCSYCERSIALDPRTFRPMS
ncbi:toll/interleukin-1 receptor domain-containing protein [Methanosalsum zhilinae]|nr:toll/interleukin-1 receptor domain-containing protein [Methanosalsum zhilinae]